MENFRAIAIAFPESIRPLRWSAWVNPKSLPHWFGGIGETQRSRARAVYINKANEPFGAYIPNGLFGFPPSLNHRLGGSNHPCSMVEAR